MPVQAPVQVQPMQIKTIPYSNRTLNSSSYRPSLQLQNTQTLVSPYKQATYRPNTIRTRMVKRPVPVRKLPVPVRTVAPVAMPMPNVSSYRPVQQVTLPPPVVSRPPQMIRPPMPTVRQIKAIPAQTAVVSPVAQVPVQRPPVITGTTIKPAPFPVQPVVSQIRPVPAPVQPVPVVSTASVRQVPITRPVPVVSQVRPVAAPVQPVPVRPVPVQPVPVRPAPIVQQVPVARPPVAVVTPVNVAPNVMRAPVQTVGPIAQPMAQNMMVKPPVYTASTYRPSVRRNMGGILPNRQVIPVVNNTLTNTTGYTTRTYRPRRL